MKTQGIYAITHVASGRVYVGSAVDVTMRWHIHRHHLNHGTHHAIRLQTAWAEAGAKAFTFSVLEAVALKADLLTREQWWIDELNALFLGSGFNSCPVAGSPLGTKHSDETKAKMRAAKLGKPAPWNVRTHTKEQNERHSAALTGRKRKPMTAETKAKMAAVHTGKKHSQATLDKMSAAQTARQRLAGRSRSPHLDQVALLIADVPHQPVGASASQEVRASRARRSTSNVSGLARQQDQPQLPL
jgi:group I intron endonuclease